MWAFCFSFNEDRRRSYFFWIHLTICLKICLRYDAFKMRLKSRNISAFVDRKQAPHHFGVDGDIDTGKRAGSDFPANIGKILCNEIPGCHPISRYLYLPNCPTTATAKKAKA